jgi:hypothetical protein
MKTAACTLAIALALVATPAFSQSTEKKKPPEALKQCRQANLDALDDLKVRTNAAARDFYVTSAQGRQLLDEREALRGKPGDVGNLKTCQEKSQKIAALGEKTDQIIAASDKVLASCRREARDQFTNMNVAVENEQYTSIKMSGRLTQENRATFGGYQKSVNDIIAKGEERGFTMADCNAQKAQIAKFRAYFASICFKDLYTVGKPTICLKAP